MKGTVPHQEAIFGNILIMTHEVGRLRRVPCLAHMAIQSAGNAPALVMWELVVGGAECSKRNQSSFTIAAHRNNRIRSPCSLDPPCQRASGADPARGEIRVARMGALSPSTCLTRGVYFFWFPVGPFLSPFTIRQNTAPRCGRPLPFRRI